MCVHVFRVSAKMPHGALVWVDRRHTHTCVLVDHRLFANDLLTPAAVTLINEALSQHSPGLTIKSAPNCARPVLSAVAG